MPLVTTTEMFKKAYEGNYAIGAFNVNNMEIIQGIVDAAKEVQSPLILQVSAGARKYARGVYLRKLVEAAVEDSELPIALHLDHGPDLESVKKCIKPITSFSANSLRPELGFWWFVGLRAC